MKHLNIDIETYCSAPIKDTGAFKYAESEDLELLLFAYSVDFGDVRVIDVKCGEEIPTEVLDAMSNDEVIKHAYNASFEFNILKNLGYDIGTRAGWRCTMVHAMYLGYPPGLALTGKAIDLPQDKKKLTAGTALIKYFSVPCKPTKANGKRTRNLPEHDKEKWVMFKNYCMQDVIAEMEIYKRLALFPVPEKEQKLWELTDQMNETGVRIDVDLVRGALDIDAKQSKDLCEKAKEITGLDNPRSTAQVLDWLQARVPDVENTTKETVTALLAKKDLPDEVRAFLEVRKELAKTSIKKYKAMETTRGTGERVRGLIQFYGASRTGRWAGRLVQVQNLPRNYLSGLDIIRELIKSEDLNAIKLIYGDASNTISQLIRTAFIPSEGDRFVVADYSAIEARVVAWLAGEEWVNEVFRTHGKIYEATAAQMFNVDFEKIKKGNPEYALRQKGKVATLALGYQGWVGALKAMGADKMGLDDEELKDIASKWRKANPNIVRLWDDLDGACIKAIKTGEDQQVRELIVKYEVEAIYGQSFLTIELPSGRKLYYPKPFLKENDRGDIAVNFFAQHNSHFMPEETYGGKLTENCVQAIARDCLGELLTKLDERIKSPVVMHIHDEVVIDGGADVNLDEVCEIMAEPISWAPGLVLKGAGFESQFYMKD